MNRKRVLHVINSLTYGGAEVLLANSLAPGGMQEHTENIVIYFQGDSVLLDKIDKRVTVINLNYKGWYTIGSLLMKIRNAIKTYKPDIIHTHLNPAGWYTAIVCPKNIPQVHTLHTSYIEDTSTGKMNLFFEKKLLLQKENINLITLSALIKEDLIKAVNIKGNVFVVSNFIDDIYFEANPEPLAPDNIFKLVAVGNIRAAKNYEYLLDIFRSLKGHPVSVDIYGFGDHSTLTSMAEKEQLAVRFMGPVLNPKDIYWKYDGFIMPSKYEGFGLTAYEAMASGLPLFLSDLETFKSLIKENAVYFSLDNPNDAVQLIIDAMNGKVDIKGMALRAKQYAQKTVRRETYIKNLLDIYSRL